MIKRDMEEKKLKKQKKRGQDEKDRVRENEKEYVQGKELKKGVLGMYWEVE